MSVTPRPEFGKPETGQIRHWFRTDAQMRRHYMAPADRELERQRMQERRAERKKYRAEAEEFKRRAAHVHTVCHDCAAGLTDVGVMTGKTTKTVDRERDTVPCCACLAALPATKAGSNLMEWGPRREAFRCRVLHPEHDEIEVEA